jgi:type II secretory pathway component HofQ
MKKINIRKIYYHVRHRYLTMNNVVVGVALVIGAGWAWGSVGMMQRNYELQKNVDSKSREAQLAELEVQSLKYEQRYYQSREYQETAVRERLGLAAQGEKVLYLPPNTQAARSADALLAEKAPAASPKSEGNFQQWMNFLFGGNRSRD